MDYNGKACLKFYYSLILIISTAIVNAYNY